MKKIEFMAPDYPPLLREIAQPPSRLYIKGRLDLEKPHIAIVGTRRATSAGREIAKRMARDLSRAGAVVVSGLAMGIDTAAHEGAVEAGTPTVAVLANGLDIIYPRQNYKLAEKMLAAGGAIISEYPEGTPSYPDNFLTRNRIVSGLSRGIVVIEAPERSGALSTASHALDQNRDVFVVPGPVSHPNYAGSHRLIQQGAALVTSAADVLIALELAPAPEIAAAAAEAALTVDQKKIIGMVREAGRPTSADAIAEKTGLGIEKVVSALAMLTVMKLIKERGGLYEW